MKIRRHRLSLAVGIIVMLSGAAAGSASFMALKGIGGESLSSAVSAIGSYAGFPAGTGSLIVLSAFLLIGGMLILAFRRRKRISMVLAVIFLAVIYLTMLSYAHIRSGNPHPGFIVSRVSEDRAGLLVVCTALEAMLATLFLSLSGKLDAHLAEREEKKRKRAELAAARLRAEAEETGESAEESASEEAMPAPGKDERRYQRMNEKAERRQRRLEERLARKEEKEAERLQRKIDRKAAAEEAKAMKRKEKESRRAAASAAPEEGEAENAFVTAGARTGKRDIDPSAPVDIPEVGELPHLKRIRTPDGSERPSRAVQSHDEAEEKPVRSRMDGYQMPPESDVFSAIKDEIEREQQEDTRKADERIAFDPSRTEPFSKGGMLEATLESMMNAPGNGSGSGEERNRRPIIGYEDRSAKKERRTSLSFAPSGLSPDHPRYRMFESLARGSNVSSFPSRGFEPAEESASAEPSVHVPGEKPKERRIPGLSGFLKKDAEESVPAEEGPEETAPVLPAEPKAEEKPAAPSFEEVSTKRPKAQHAAEEVEEEADGPDEGTSVPRQENELSLSVGIGGLQSNDLGYAGISQRAKKKYRAPSMDILVDYPQASSEIDDFTRQRGGIIVDTLASYHVSVTLSNIIKGPTVTLYELKLGDGVLVQRIRARVEELSYNLGGDSIRFLASIPGRQAVGIEVPNRKRATIGFKDMLMSVKKDHDSQKLRVPMILGRTITGSPVTIDVAKMPHMLIAGSTGSGKSVCINSFICSLIYLKSPQEVRLIMVDPKVVELTVYNGIPHLLTPVITEAKKVVKALGWLCEEMDRRYRMLAAFGVRNIEGLNTKIRDESIPAEKLPYIVLIMDEFADLMSVVGKDIETYVARLAAKARAAGIHLILATQRPSSEVVTGTIKNNFPARIAFAVSSGTNSRIILDENGAEDLLGKGDMLLMNPAESGFQRIQGAFLSDDEVYEVVGQAKKNGEPDYLAEDIFEEAPEADDDAGDDIDVSEEDSDEVLYEKAKQIVFERKCASASFLQRRMKIGYNRAARLIEMMEDNGIVGPANGSKPREILKYFDD